QIRVLIEVIKHEPDRPLLRLLRNPLRHNDHLPSRLERKRHQTGDGSPSTTTATSASPTSSSARHGASCTEPLKPATSSRSCSTATPARHPHSKAASTRKSATCYATTAA